MSYGGAALVPMVVPMSWGKCLSMNERLFFLRMVSSSILIVWGLGATGVRVLMRKCFSMNERLLFFRMVSSSIPIVWGLGVTGGRVLACNFM